MSLIRAVHAREVFDSRGHPTVEVDVLLHDGAWGRGIVPSGASTGKAEALEMRDHEANRFQGRGVRKAVANVNETIGPALRGAEAGDQQALDARLIELDGTANKSRLGANAILGVSLATARAAASSAGVPLYRHLGGSSAKELPVPMVNILSGGIHGGGNVDFQDYMVIPLRSHSFAEALEDSASVYRAMKQVLKLRGAFRPGVADEGGYAPLLKSNEEGFELMVEAFERADLRPGKDAAIAVDVAASHFGKGSGYTLAAEGSMVDSAQLVQKLVDLAGRYPILSIEDGMGEDDWAGWQSLTRRISSRCQLIGDDLFATNALRLEQGIESGAANSVLVKMNQVGTLSETLHVMEIARRHGYRTVVSARSGETEDDSMADLAVGTSASQIKIGSVTCSERLAKYNRLQRIEQDLGGLALYRGEEVYSGFLHP